MSTRVLHLAVAGLALCALPRELAAQYDACRPGAGSNEAKTLALFSVPLTFPPSTMAWRWISNVIPSPFGPSSYRIGWSDPR